MSCCGVKLEARRNADKRVTYTPSSRRFSFSGLSPVFTVRRGDMVLLTVNGSPLSNGSVFQIVGDSMVLTLEKADLVVLDSVTPDTEQEVLSYDVVATDQAGFENWILGGPFILLGINDQSCGDCDSDVEVSLGGQCVDITIEGGNLAVGSSVALAELNAAVTQASDSAEDAAASAVQAEAAAATAVGALANKADTDGGNIGPDFIDTAPYQRDAANTAVITAADKLSDTLSVRDFLNPTPGNRFGFAQSVAGARGRSIHVPTGSYELGYNLAGGPNTWWLDGPVTLTGTGGANGLPGKVVWPSGVTNPDGTTAFANPFYIGRFDRRAIGALATDLGRTPPLSTSTFLAYSTNGQASGTFVTAASDNSQSGYDEGGIGVLSFAVNDRTSPLKTVYAGYFEAVRYAGAGNAFGLEIDTVNLGSLVVNTPANIFGGGLPAGNTSGLWIASGGSTPGANPSTAAISVLANGTTWDKGIVFSQTAFTDRGDGTREAVALGLGHFLAGYNAAGAITSRIYFEGSTAALGTQLRFNDGGFSIRTLANANLATFDYTSMTLGNVASSPTGIGRIRLPIAAGGNSSDNGGLEFLANATGSGFGYRFFNSTEAVGGAASLKIQGRANSTTWQDIGKFQVSATAGNSRFEWYGPVSVRPGSSVTPAANGDVVFELTNNTTLTIRARGSDGTVRSVALTLA